MVVEQIKKFRKNAKKSKVTEGSRAVGEDLLSITLGGIGGWDEWADALLLLMERLDELRQFAFERIDDETKRKKASDARANAFAMRHAETELKQGIYEILMLLNDVRANLGHFEIAELDLSIRGDKLPDTRRTMQLAQRNRTKEEKSRRFIQK